MKPGFAKVCGLVAVGCVLFAAGTVDPAGNRIRIAFADSVVGGVNDEDVRIAIRGWAATIMHDTGMTIEYDPAVISTADQIVHKIRAHEVDGFGLSVFEFVQVAPLIHPTLVIDERDAQGGDQYLVLVNEESSIQDLGGLRGHSLTLYKHPKMCMALPWLETALAVASLGPSDSFFVRKTGFNKLAKVVLPVFFNQADACLVSRQGFETMSELNPQLAKKLRVVARSPKMLSTMLAFHKDCPAVRRQRYAEAMTGLYKSVTGRQALTLFQTARLVQGDTSLLKSAVEVLGTYERLKAKPGAKK